MLLEERNSTKVDQKTGFSSAGNTTDQESQTPINLEFKDEHEPRHRMEAVRSHFARARQHLLNITLSIAMIAGAPVYWRAIYSELGLSYSTFWPITSLEKWIASSLHLLNGVGGIVSLAALLTITVFPPIWSVGHLILYRRERDRDWRVAEAQAGERDPTSGARGYMKVFRLYARTKRRGIFTLMYGVAGFWWGLVGVFCFAIGVDGAPGTIALGYLVTAFVAILGWLVVLYLGYDIGRRYVPGNVLVTKTLILSVLATTSQTNYTDAREAARELEAEIVEEKPWWFYSYKKKPKRYV
ncbi:MAG: hypothetical protein ACE5FO_08175 [Parvularculaceae bacterium]